MDLHHSVVELEVLLARISREELDPGWDGPGGWTLRRQQLLVDSVLRRWPIPPIVVAGEDEHETVLDGRERLRALWSFTRDELPVAVRASSVGEYLAQLDGMLHSQLPARFRRRVGRYGVPVVRVSEHDDGELRELMSRWGTASSTGSGSSGSSGSSPLPGGVVPSSGGVPPLSPPTVPPPPPLDEPAVAERAMPEPTSAPTLDPRDEPGREPGPELGREPTPEPGREPGLEPALERGRESGLEPWREPGPDAGRAPRLEPPTEGVPEPAPRRGRTFAALTRRGDPAPVFVPPTPPPEAGAPPGAAAFSPPTEPITPVPGPRDRAAGAHHRAAESDSEPIFDELSAWFLDVAESRAGGDGAWSSPADTGYEAAQAALHSPTGGLTAAGLPIRDPAARLAPGAVLPPPRSGPARPSDPQAIGENLARFREGASAAREDLSPPA
ncbi:hypothetical protein ACR9E3_27070 [Actinomycetospora sp. C-140]